MNRRKQVSKRRWKARLDAGKWVPTQVIIALDNAKDLSQNYQPHPTEKGFLKLRRLRRLPRKSLKSLGGTIGGTCGG